MILKQYYLGCLAHASYLVADQASGIAAVVDPQRDVDAYIEDAHRIGCRIAHVFLTHFHADFVAGHLELRDREDAEIYLGARAEAEYDFTPLAHEDRVAFGHVRLEVLETPGHSPESISILVYDLESDQHRPHAVLSGDTLFIGDVGRPDLRASMGCSAEHLGGMLYDSLHDKLLTLPDETLVYPAHGAGSLCGKNLSTDTVSTIGVQRRYNYALQPMSREEFVRVVTAEQPEPPAYFSYDAVLNTQERPTLERALAQELRPLALGEALALTSEGAVVLDTRDPADFAGAHLAGSVNIGLGGSYATWAGTILDRGRPLVVIADLGRETEAAVRLGRIGFDNVAGFLEGGMQAADARPDLLARIERVTAVTLAAQLTGSDPPLILDVRAEHEWRQARLGGSLNIPLGQLPGRLDELPEGRRLVVHCHTGYRSSIAASLLLREGREQIADLVGGISALYGPTLSVTNEGIWGNEVLTDTQCCGVSTLKRIDRDVFTQPNVRDVLFLEGINDIGCSETAFALCTGSTPAITAAKVIAGYRRVIADAHKHHVRIFGATLTAFKNSEEYAPAYWTPVKERIRELVNAWIRQPGHFDGVVDFARATADPHDPQIINPIYDGGDHLHPNDQGYQAMANAINLRALQ